MPSEHTLQEVAMSVDEFLYWIWRVFLVLIFGLILIIILTTLIPYIEANELRADLLSARIAHNGGFHEAPGVIDPARFTQEVADEAFAYVASEQRAGSQIIRTHVGAAAWVTSRDGDTLLDPILYNRNAYNLLAPRRDRGDATVDTRALPALLSDGTPVYLHIEVLYEPERGDTERRERTVPEERSVPNLRLNFG